MKNKINSSLGCFPKVLHLRSTEGLLGAENVIIELARHSEEYGYHSIIGVLQNETDPTPELIFTARENRLQTIIFACNGRIDLKCAKQIHEFIAVNNVNLIHCHGYKENFYALLCKSGIPKLATNHLWKATTLMLRLYRFLDIFMLRSFDRVVGVSDEIVNEMKTLGINGAVKVQNGIDIVRFNIDPKAEDLARGFGLNSNGIVFGMVSSLTHEKNHAIALNALAKLKEIDAQLLIVGDGPLLKELEEQVAQLGLTEKVFFIGRRGNIREILSIVDVFLLPSLKEGLPMALLEAMACGKAVIASRVGENANVINDRENGIIVEPGDTTSLVNAMRLLIEQNKMIKQFGQQARNRVEDLFSSHIMTRNYCKLYDQLLTSDTA